MKNTNDNANSFFNTIKNRCSMKCTKIKELFKSNKLLSLGLIFVIAAFLMGYFLKGLFIAAIVNGKPISRIRIIRELEKYQGASALESVITEMLILQEAKKKGVEVTNDELNTEIATIEASLIQQGQTLDEVLISQKMTKEDLEKNLTLNKLIEKLLSDRIVVTDEEIQSFIEKNKSSFPEGTDMDQVKTLVKQQLSKEKMNSQYQSWIEELKAASNIRTVVKY